MDRTRKAVTFLKLLLVFSVTLMVIVNAFLTKLQFFTSVSKPLSNRDVQNKSKPYECQLIEPRLSATPLPITGLVSFPGAGNTWTRHLLQQASGLATASIYCDGAFRKNGFPYECYREYENVVAVKSHSSRQTFSRVILILRNPVDTFLAYFNFLNAGHTGESNAVEFNTSWTDFVNLKTKRWENFYSKWLCDFSGPLYPLLYENLQKNTYNELKNIFEFLHLKVNESLLVCTVQNQEGNFHRNKTKENLSDLYTETMKMNIKLASEHVAGCLQRKYAIRWNYHP